MKTIHELIAELEKNPIEKGGHVYHPIPFSEFDHLNTSLIKDEFLKKANLILEYIYKKYTCKLEDLNILDIGANGGYFTFTLSNKVASVTTFETNIRYTEICQAIIREKNINNVDWNHSPFYIDKLKKDKKYNVSLMLSVFQWMAEGGANLKTAFEDLNYISQVSECLIFELGFNSGNSAITTNKEDHYEALIDMLKENTVYTSFELLGTSEFWHGSKRYIVACTK